MLLPLTFVMFKHCILYMWSFDYDVTLLLLVTNMMLVLYIYNSVRVLSLSGKFTNILLLNNVNVIPSPWKNAM
jgi:hypothetical protein